MSQTAQRILQNHSDILTDAKNLQELEIENC